MSHRIEQLTADEQANLADVLGKALELCREVGGDPAHSTAPSLEALDAVWSAFSTHLRQTGDDPKFLVNIIGVAFGQRLVDELGLGWGYVTDEYGTDLAVHGQPNNVLVCPCDVIAKRWDRGEDQFIAALYTAMSTKLREVLSNGA